MSSAIDLLAALTIGHVESVAPDEIKVVLELDAPQATALNTGHPTRFPRLNGFVLIPNEIGSLVGLVSWLGVERSPFPKRTGLRDFGLVDLPFPLRKLSITPLGTLRASIDDLGSTTFELERGVSAFPSVGDPVQLPTSDQLRAIVEASGSNRRVAIGSSPLAANAKVSVDPDKLFGRHLAVLGNTGSGKSCSVAGLIRWSLEAASASGTKPPRARFIILDPNGEYLTTFSDLAGATRIFQAPMSKAGANTLLVPAWMWNSQEWAAFAQAAPATQRPLLLQALRNLRSGSAAALSPPARLARLLRGYGSMITERIARGPAAYSTFGPSKSCGQLLENLATGAEQYIGEAAVDDQLGAVVSSARNLADQHRYSYSGGTGFNDFSEPELAQIRSAIEATLEALPQLPRESANEDAPLPFDPNELADHLELLGAESDLGQTSQFIATLTMRIRMMLADQRLGPIVAPADDIAFARWLESFLGTEDASSGQIAIVDLSLVPPDVLHVVVAVLARIVFESTQRYRKLYNDELPTVLVLEEAHTFIRRRDDTEGVSASAHLCRDTFERIAREGRKFGLGLVLSSQRPSELSPTALAQCNTFLLHRIVNDRDQQLVGRLVPDNLGDLLRELPSLPSRHAVLLGWATPVPVLVEMTELPKEHRPRSSDPQFWDVWTGLQARSLDWERVAADWIGAGAEAPGTNTDTDLDFLK